MDKTLTCDCGFVAQARDDAGLATEVRRHAWDAHGMRLSHDEALLVLFHAELQTSGFSFVPFATTAPERTTVASIVSTDECEMANGPRE